MGPKKKDKGNDGDALTRIAIVGAEKYVLFWTGLSSHRWLRYTIMYKYSIGSTGLVSHAVLLGDV